MCVDLFIQIQIKLKCLIFSFYIITTIAFASISHDSTNRITTSNTIFRGITLNSTLHPDHSRVAVLALVCAKTNIISALILSYVHKVRKGDDTFAFLRVLCGKKFFFKFPSYSDFCRVN